MAEEHGTATSGYKIAENATLAQCIGYAQSFVVRPADPSPHYRYDRYMNVLQRAPLDRLATTGRLVHVDIGCGPGLFSWVVRDRFRHTSKADVVFYGYDHSTQMAALANIMWHRFREEARYSCFHTIDDLNNGMRLADTERYHVLFTLGYVLVQTVDNDLAVESFARLIAKHARMTDCLMIAVDGQAGRWPEDFGRALGKLKISLDRRGVTIDVRPAGASEAITPVWRTSGT